MDSLPTPYQPGLPQPSSGAERLAAVASHASLLLGIPLVGPLAVLLVFPMLQPASAYVRNQALQAFMFHLLLTIVGGVLGAGASALFGFTFLFPPFTWIFALLNWPLALALVLVAGGLFIWGVAIALVASLKAFLGEPYTLPIVGSWAR